MAGGAGAACLFLALLFQNWKRGGAASVEAIEAKYTEMLRAAAAELVDRYERLEELTAACACSHHICANVFPGLRCLDIKRDPHPDEEIASKAASLLRCDADCGHRRVSERQLLSSLEIISTSLCTLFLEVWGGLRASVCNWASQGVRCGPPGR